METGEWLSYNPLHGDRIPQQTKVWIASRRRLHLLRVPVRRSGALRDQDLGHAPRQHLVRRLGRPQPRCARHRPALVSPDGEPEWRAARHAEQRRRATKIESPDYVWDSAGRLNADRLRRRDPPAAADASASRAARDMQMGILFWRRVSRARRVGLVARARARQVGLRAARRAGVRRAPVAAAARGHSVDDLRAKPAARRALRLGRRRRRGGRRAQREVRAHVDDHARCDGQSRLQPGRERRVPGRGEPALPGLLLGEAAVLHGRRGHLHARRQGNDNSLQRAVHTRRIVDPIVRRQGHGQCWAASPSAR